MTELKQVERAIRIYQRLACNREVTIRELYEFFERKVEVRTLQRDMIELSSANIPLATRKGRGKEQVWYLITDSLKFIPETIGSQELLASYFIERLAEVTQGTKLEKDIRSLLKKSKQLLAPDVFRSLDASDMREDFFGATFTGYIDYSPHSETIDRLVAATSERRKCTFKYKSPNKERVSEFEAEPYLLLFHKGALYAVVYTPKHDSYLFLPIQRIREVKLLPATFKRKRGFSLEKLREGRFGIYGGDGLKPQKVVLRFSKGIADVVAERVWHPSQKLTSHRDGSLTLEFRVVISDELRAWVGSWLDYVKVVKPADLLVRTADAGQE